MLYKVLRPWMNSAHASSYVVCLEAKGSHLTIFLADSFLCVSLCFCRVFTVLIKDFCLNIETLLLYAKGFVLFSHIG